jgi:hypothetical protein
LADPGLADPATIRLPDPNATHDSAGLEPERPAGKGRHDTHRRVLTLELADYEEAADAFNRCRERGIQGSNTDFLICSAALRREIAVYAADHSPKRPHPRSHGEGGWAEAETPQWQTTVSVCAPHATSAQCRSRTVRETWPATRVVPRSTRALSRRVRSLPMRTRKLRRASRSTARLPDAASFGATHLTLLDSRVIDRRR